MTDRATEIALFRYALIREAADATLSHAERGRRVRALADGEHPGVDGMPVCGQVIHTVTGIGSSYRHNLHH
jgi:hypothetical protein